MVKKKFNFFSFFILVICASCASPVLEVRTSQPDVKISVSREGQNLFEGTGSAIIPSASFLEQSGLVQIEISKEAFETKKIVIPSQRFVSSVRLDVELKPQAKDQIDPSLLMKANLNNTKLSEVVKDALGLQVLITSSRYAEATRQLQKFQSEYPGVAIFHDLMGNISYLQGNLSSALASYREAQRLGPSNTERERMIGTIEGAMNR
jgi:tetratricopeptide (TPR) repeat protein